MPMGFEQTVALYTNQTKDILNALMKDGRLSPTELAAKTASKKGEVLLILEALLATTSILKTSESFLEKEDPVDFLFLDGERLPVEPPSIEDLETTTTELKRKAAVTLKNVKAAETAGL